MNDQSSEPVTDEYERMSIGKAVGLKDFPEVRKYAHQIDRLMEWARVKGAKDSEDMVWQIRQLANRVGGPTIGNNWAQHLSTYAYLEMEKLKIDKQLKEIEGDGQEAGSVGV